MSLQSILNALSSLSAFAVAAGLLLNLAVQPRRTLSAGLLALLSTTLLIWGGVGRTTLPHRPEIAVSVMAAALLVYFIFIVRYLHVEARLAVLLGWGAPAALVLILLVVWVAGGITGDDLAVVQGAGSSVFIVLTVYTVVAFWSILISRAEQAPALRSVGLLMIAASACPLLQADWVFSLAILLASAATAWLGLVIVRAQAFAPILALQDELRTANRDLRQALGEAADLRARNDILSQELQASGQYRSDFLDQLAHKLRTPLNSIAGYTELMQSGLYGDLTEMQQDRLLKITRNSDALLDVISNMLDLNKINAGRLDLNPTILSINALIERISRELGARFPAKSPQLQLEADLPPISGDEIRLCQIITQLIENALKFSLEGSVRVTSRRIEVKNGSSPQFPMPVTGWLGDGDWIVIAVADTGIGFAPEDQARVFDPFFQVDDPRIEAYQGSGLGLTIAKRLAEIHKGALWFKSAPDAGTTFFLALPVAGSAGRKLAGSYQTP